MMALVFSGFAQTDTIPHDGLDRSYLLHVPPSYTGDEPTPLIIAMHGGFGSGPQLEGQSQLSQKSDAEGFIVVYPNGVLSPLQIRTWNAGECCGYSAQNNIDDVGFLMAMLDTLENQLAIDTSRIYATGMSNGAFMSYRLACERSERIAAIAPVAGSMALEECQPQRAVPVMHLHSYLDENIPAEGGVGSGFSTHHNPPLDSVMNAWAAFSNCTTLNDTLQADEELTHVSWSDCDCNNEMQLLISEDGGHSWPGGNGTIIGDPPSEVLDGNDLMWAFFQDHSLECQGASGLVSPSHEQPAIYPNPTEGLVHVQIDAIPSNLEVFDIYGKLVHRSHQSRTADLTALDPGVYLLKVMVGEKVYIQKVLLR